MPGHSRLSHHRRTFLQSTACGFGWLALAGMAGRTSARADGRASSPTGGPDVASDGPGADPLAPRAAHFPARAKRVVFLFMQGGPSHVDTFDYKPAMEKHDGAMRSFDDARTLAKTKKVIEHRVMKSPWKFRQHGECGMWGSDLFPHLSARADDLCLVRSMHTDGVAHGPATLFMHTGSINQIRPSVGAWVQYGLGAENRNLPGFVSICPSMGNGGPRNWGNAFLPTACQGTTVGRAGIPASEAKIRNIANDRLTTVEQRRQFELLQELNRGQTHGRAGDSELDAVIGSYELAFRMQNTAPGILDLSGETKETHRAYGIGEKGTDSFGRQCLMARRLLESGVRYVQVNYGDNSANPAWDQHSNLPKHADHAFNTDRPAAALLADLKQRGLLEDTLFWFGGEFGRTPYAEKNGTGRDHNPDGFSVLLAGGGVKPGFQFGETDDFGHHAVVDKIHMHDLHATLLHLLGLDHERLTFRHAGRDFRLTDIHGRVVKEIMG